MNKQPVDYKQYDSRWGSQPYRTSGESSTIKSAGCGPSCAAMVIATLKDKSVTPKTCCDWSMAHGYKALNQGTYYAYFVPQMEAYGITCRQLTGGYDEAVKLLKEGYYVIALMGKGLWTSGGHFVLAWWADSKIRINDPASTAEARLNGDPALFKAQAKYFWAVDARAYNQNGNALPNNTIKDTRIDSVSEVQEWLNDSYTAGLDVDGVYGAKPKKAIVTALQIELGLTGKDVDGVTGSKTLGALPTLRSGSSGKFVKLLQCLLVCHGHRDAFVDGAYGNGTASAVRNVQARVIIGVDGVCGKQTWSVLVKA